MTSHRYGLYGSDGVRNNGICRSPTTAGIEGVYVKAQQQEQKFREGARARCGSRVCVLTLPSMSGDQFDSLAGCQDSCDWTYQCPSVAGDAAVKVHDTEGQRNSSNVGCYACENGNVIFKPNATGHYNIDGSASRNYSCSAMVAPILNNLKYVQANGSPSSTIISAYGLLKLADIKSGGNYMTINLTVAVSLPPSFNARLTAGDNSMVASLIVVRDDPSWSSNIITTYNITNSRTIFAWLPEVLVTGSIYNESTLIANQTQTPGIVLVPLLNATYNVKLSEREIPVRLNDQLTIYAYFGYATSGMFTVQVVEQPSSQFVFNSDRIQLDDVNVSQKLIPPYTPEQEESRGVETYSDYYLIKLGSFTAIGTQMNITASYDINLGVDADNDLDEVAGTIYIYNRGTVMMGVYPNNLTNESRLNQTKIAGTPILVNFASSKYATKQQGITVTINQSNIGVGVGNSYDVVAVLLINTDKTVNVSNVVGRVTFHY